MTSQYIAWFEEIHKGDVPTVGGKGANLGEMVNAGFPVPYGFVITSNAYFDVIEHNNLRHKIASLLTFVNFEQQKELEQASAAIRSLILKAEVPKPLIHAIVSAYSELTFREAKRMGRNASTIEAEHDPLVAVRSSATAEDLPQASFAGQQETYLNVKGDHVLLDKVRSCWASLFTDRAVYYRAEQGFDHLAVGLAAVVQRMVQSDVSGISFSIDPVTNNKEVVTIEAIYGLGEYIVQGTVTPDHYEVIKKETRISKKEIKQQKVAFVRKGNKNIETSISSKSQSLQKLSDQQIVDLAKIILKIERHYFFPQDIEWALENGVFFIVQSRPITTLDGIRVRAIQDGKHELLLKGDPASPGLGVGTPIIIKNPSEIGKVKTGMVLIAPMTDPDYVPAMKRASAIVTEKGGRTSHAAIVSRELGLPAVVGAVDATKILQHEPIVTVNGSTGEIFKGSVEVSDKRQIASNKIGDKHLRTITKVYVNLAEVERAKEVSLMDVDGVGLLRAEFMIADIGEHPKEFIRTGQEQVFINTLASKLKHFVSAFNPRPVVYRATDFKTNEYRSLKGGDRYEPIEENPMLGYRGATRYITDRQVFKMELESIIKVRDSGFKNLHLMIPFVRSPHELVEIKKMLEFMGLSSSPTFKLWIMVEIPSVALMLEEYIKIGIDGVSVGTNDLTMLTLGVDRDNEAVAHLYKETDPSVIYLIEKIVKTARKHNITVSVCGQAASDYADLRERLIRLGVTSLSVNIDTIERVRHDIYEFERQLWQK